MSTDQKTLYEVRGPINIPKVPKNISNMNTTNDLSLRESACKSLFKDLDIQDSNLDPCDLMYNSEQLANLIEEEVYENTGRNCKNNKVYREKIQKYLHNRLIGNKNNFVRKALKTGGITVHDFCQLSNTQLEDDNYLNMLLNNHENIPLKSNKPPKFNVTNRPNINFLTAEEKNENNQTEEEQNNFVSDSKNIYQNINEVYNNIAKSSIINGENILEDRPSQVIQLSENHENLNSNFPLPKDDVISDEHKELVISKISNVEQKLNNESNNLNSTETFLREKNLVLNKEINEQKLSQIKIEKEIEIQNKQFEFYQEEIQELREANTNLKLRLSSINQEAHQLEIDKLNNKILIKDKEIDLLEKQTISLNSKINGLENFIKNVLEESTKHRQIMEENLKAFRTSNVVSEFQQNKEDSELIKKEIEVDENSKNKSENIFPMEELTHNIPEKSDNFLKTENQDQKSDIHLEKAENVIEKINILPPKINDSYKNHSKLNPTSIQNRVIPTLNDQVKTSESTNEKISPNEKINPATKFFDNEIENTDMLSSQYQIVTTNVPKESEESNVYLRERKNSIKEEKNKTERKISESCKSQGIINQMVSPSTSQINNFFDDDNDHQQDYLNKSHVQPTVTSKAISQQKKILTPHREVKQIEILNNQLNQQNETKNTFFGEEFGESNNLIVNQMNISKTKLNIPLQKTSINPVNKIIKPVIKKIENPTISNIIKTTDKPASKILSVQQDPFIFHQDNDNDFENIFDSLSTSSVSKPKIDNKKNNYFD